MNPHLKNIITLIVCVALVHFMILDFINTQEIKSLEYQLKTIKSENIVLEDRCNILAIEKSQMKMNWLDSLYVKEKNNPYVDSILIIVGYK